MLANGDGLELDLLALENTPHYFTARLRTLNQAVDLTFTIGAASKTPILLEKIDPEWSLYGATFSANESNGQTTAEITLDSSGTPGIWIDGVQVEPTATGGKWTTYCDGTQEGCRWLGAPHASASTRSADSRAGGVVKSFWEGYGFFPEKALGMGTAVEELNIDSFAFLPGGELNSSKIPPREFSVIGYFLGDTVEELHEQAQALELELGLDTYPGRQPVRLRYYGAKVQKEIAARYAGGLEGDLPIFYNDDFSVEDEKWVNNYKFKMRASVQFVATDPFWYEVGESATLLDTNEGEEYRLIARRGADGIWSPLGPPSYGGVLISSFRAFAEDETYLYMGGDFEDLDGVVGATHIARYNKATGVYSAMGTGADNVVLTLAKMPNGDIVAGGIFTSMGGVANTNGIARWVVATETWQAMGTGSDDNGVFALTVGLDGLLYAGGEFTGMGGVANTAGVAYWDGAWNPMDTGVDSDAVYALTTVPTTGDIIVGGTFPSMSGVANTQFIASWNLVAWESISSGITGGLGSILALVATSNGLVYAGGDFDTIDGVSASNIAVYNQTAWFALGDGVNDSVLSVKVGIDGLVYVSGAFSQAGNLTIADRMALWNGYTWTHLGIDLAGNATVYTFLPSEIEVDPVTEAYALYLGWLSDVFYGTTVVPGIVSANNEGTISAFPQIVFSRSGGDDATIQLLRNDRTTRELLFNYSLLDGESLTIDLNPKNRTITSSFFGPRMGAVLANSDLSTWQLLPGSNSVSSFVSEDGSPTITGYLLWREPYRGWN
jgi:hypothetical protein